MKFLLARYWPTLIVFMLAMPVDVLEGQSKASTQAASKRQVHGELFAHIGIKGKKITEQPPDTIRISVGEAPIHEGPPPSKAEQLKGMACRADLVVVGTIATEESFLTKDEGFVFTELGFRIEEVIKSSPGIRHFVGEQILVVRPGGEFEYNGQKIKAVSQDFGPHRINGRYLFFLRLIPATGAFQAWGEATFELRNRRVFFLSPAISWRRASPGFDDLETPIFLGEVRQAANEICQVEIKR